MADPAPHVKYRIKSVDFLTYLELLDRLVTSMTDVRLRPAKETDCQYWQFEKVSGYTGYFVRNVANSHQCLYLSDGTVYAKNELSTANAIVNVSYQDGAYQLAFRHEHLDYYFHTSDNSHLNTTVHVKPLSEPNLDRQRWQLIPVTSQPIYKDILESDNYRVRNLNGKSLLTMPEAQSIGSTNVYVRSQLDQSPYQRWTVTRQESGLYIIQNSGNGLHLGCISTLPIVGDDVVGMQTIYLWDIQSVGGYAWSLHVPATAFSIGVADNEIEDKDEMTIVPGDNTSSQIWFMEKYIPLGQDKIYAKREVPEGKYLIRNAIYGLNNANHDPVYMSVFNNPWRIVPRTDTSTQFELKYVDNNSAHFTLTYVTNLTPAPVVADVGGYVGLDYKGTEFVLLERDKSDPGYVICRPDSGRPHKVVSGRARTDINKNSVFSIDNKVAGEAMQMWMLVPVS